MIAQIPPQPPPAHTKAIRLSKGIALVTALTGAMAYGFHLRAIGAVKCIDDIIIVQTGDYFWHFPLSFGLAVQWLAGLLFLFYMTVEQPGRSSRKTQPWQSFLITWTGLALVLLLAYKQISGTRIIMPFFTIAAVSIAGPFAWLMASPRQTPTLSETMAESLSSRMATPATRTLALACLTALSLITSVIAWQYIYMGHPLVTDAQSQIAQARLLLSGHWRLEISQALRDVIAFPYAVESVPSFSQYPPGHILLLLPVLAMGLPAQALNIAAASLTALLVMRLALRFFGGEAALVAGLLMASSPFILVMNGGAMNHVTTACLLMAAIACLMPTSMGATVGRTPWLAFLGGLCLGWAAATRPLTGLAHGLVWGGFAMGLLIQGLWQRRPSHTGPSTSPHPARTIGHGLLVTLGVFIPMAVFLFFNWKTTGNALLPGYIANNPALHRLGIHEAGPYPYSTMNAINNTVANFFSFNTQLLGWPIGSLVVLMVWLIRTRLERPERLLIALIAFQTFLYFLYHFHDLFLGPRFLFETAPLLILLAAGGLGSILKGRDLRAGLLWLLIVVMSVSSGFTGLCWWHNKHNATIVQHDAVEQFLQNTLPVDRNTVIVIREPAQEMIGRHFSAPTSGKPTLWFVPAKKEAQARKLPELQGFQWLYYPPRN